MTAPDAGTVEAAPLPGEPLWLAKIRKAVYAGLVAGVFALLAQAQTAGGLGEVDGVGWLIVAAAVLVPGGGTFLIPNAQVKAGPTVSGAAARLQGAAYVNLPAGGRVVPADEIGEHSTEAVDTGQITGRVSGGPVPAGGPAPGEVGPESVEWRP